MVAATMMLPAVSHAAYMPGTSGYGQFANQMPPETLNKNLDTQATMLCYETFCSYENGILRIPVYSAEHLTARQVMNAKGASRKEMSFHPDAHIPAAYSSAVRDFTGSGYDRGHMAPWADSADPDCFTLANILPQDADNNRHLWEGIETSTRNLALQYGEVYVVSGPIFTQSSIAMLNERVAIPNYLYKAIYIPSLNATAAYVVANKPGYAWTQVNISDVEKLAHVNPFPSVSSARYMELPKPDVHGRKIPMSSSFPFTSVNYPNTSTEEHSEIHSSNENEHPVLKAIGRDILRSWLRKMNG